MRVKGAGSGVDNPEDRGLVDEDTLLYEYTVNAPTYFTQPFTVALPMRRSDNPMYEYACHEGNRGLEVILSGGRIEERAPEKGQ